MIDSTKAVGIKLYPGGSDYGTSTVSNVTWDGVTVQNCGYAAQIQSCYSSDADYCDEYPSEASLTGIYFKNFAGTTSTSYSPVTANINCPAGGTCDLYFSDWSINAPSGTSEVLCNDIDTSPGITCVSGASG
jgi:galacturan 1,4-alpha-galacturonidase